MKNFVRQYLLGFAKRGERCPRNREIRDAAAVAGCVGNSRTALIQLKTEGILRTEVYAKNYRVAIIDGLRTKEPPAQYGKPYKVSPPYE